MVEKGFKKTEIGVLPEDWAIDFLSKITDLVTDGAHLSPPTSKDGFPIATVENINKGFINIESCRVISDKDYLYLVRNNCKPITGDVLLSKDGTIGITFVINDNPNVVLLSSIALIRPNKTLLNSEYLSQVLSSHWFYIYLNRVQAGSALTRIVLRDIKNFYLALPPLPEQQAIAQALSDADAWIASLEQLIAKKRLIKQGAMQELLTPKKGWEVKRLGEVGSFLSTNSLSRDNLNYTQGRVYNIHYGDIHTQFKSHFNIERELVPFINEESLINKNFNFCEVGDLIIADASENESDIGKAIEIWHLGENKVVSGLHTMHFKPHKDTFSSGYLGYIWQSSFVKLQILKQSQGTKVLGISVTRLLDLILPIPSLTEQTRIATILSDIDSELESLEQQLSKAQQIKQGMMQELLTGRVRLVKN